ncbi:hypothetical protein [Thermoplasma sp.]|uniref:hypothetical protein n=1 Tax=Thermoplasma sp. TaxID=1973142 RepID=UPI00262D4F2F|nr:hypothetical protein [Thermoplasma sp.]
MTAEELKLALALSWALRADGKMSHAGFNACMRELAKVTPVELWDHYGLDGATLHAHENLQRFIREVETSILTSISETKKMKTEIDWEKILPY